MGGIASFLGGLGAGAGQYREQVLNRWMQSRDSLAQLIANEVNNEDDPQRRAELLKHELSIRTAKPGTDLTKTIQGIGESSIVHPGNVSLLQSAGIIPKDVPAPPPPPGPTPPGSVAGTGGNALGQLAAPPSPAQSTSSPNPLGSLITMPGDIPVAKAAGNVASPPPSAPAAPLAAQPGTSPVQPARQAAPPITSTPAPAPFNPASVPGVSTFGSDVNGFGQGPLGADVVRRYEQARTSGLPIPRRLQEEIQPYLSSEAANYEALNKQKLLDQYTLALGPQRTEALANAVDKMNTDPRFAGMPDVQKFSLAAEAIGMKSSIIPAGYMNPVLESAGTPGSAAPPGTLDSLGNPVMPTGNYRIQRDKLNGKPIWTPINLQHQLVQTNEGGIAVVNPQNPNGGIQPIPNAVAPSQNTPHYMPNATGGVEVVTPGRLAAGAPPIDIPGAVTPGMLTTESGSATSPTGERSAFSRKVLPGGSTGAGGPLPNSPHINPSAATSAHSVTMPPGPDFRHPSDQQINYAVEQLTRPNMSDANRSDVFKQVVGNDKYLADAVRRRLASSGTDVKPLSQAMADQAVTANQVESHLSTINTLIGKLGDDGLGPIMGRWNEFMAGKVGAGNPDYARLRLNMGLLETALGRVHGGARGGGSPQMLQHFAHLMNSDRMDPTTLKATLGEVKSWLDTYANPNESGQLKKGVSATSPADLKSLSTEELMRRLTGGNK